MVITISNFAQFAQGKKIIPPTIQDLSYGPSLSQRIDFWQANTDLPAPIVLLIHGGGFRNGSKESFHNKKIVSRFIEAGISVAAIEYRFIDQAPLPAAHTDVARALQFIRYNAEKWHIDKTRVGAFGNSAGAQLCMYLAFNDDLADLESTDPIARESTRLCCVATKKGQATMLYEWWKTHIPEFNMDLKYFMDLFAAVSQQEYIQKAQKISAINLLTKDDPPLYMTYSKVPGDFKREENTHHGILHHVASGSAIKEKMDKLGIEAILVYPRQKSPLYQSKEDFLIKKLSQQ